MARSSGLGFIRFRGLGFRVYVAVTVLRVLFDLGLGVLKILIVFDKQQFLPELLGLAGA